MSKFKKAVCYCLIFNIFFTNILTSIANTVRASATLSEDLEKQNGIEPLKLPTKSKTIDEPRKISAKQVVIERHITEEWEEKYTLKGFKVFTGIWLTVSILTGLLALLAWEPINAKTLFTALGIGKLGVGTENAFYEATGASHWMFFTGAAAYIYAIFKFGLKAEKSVIQGVKGIASKVKQCCAASASSDLEEGKTSQETSKSDEEKLAEDQKKVFRKTSIPQGISYFFLDLAIIVASLFYTFIMVSYLYEIEMPRFSHFFNFFAPFLILSIMTDKLMTGHSKAGKVIQWCGEKCDQETTYLRNRLKNTLHQAKRDIKSLNLDTLKGRNTLRQYIKSIFPEQASSVLDEEEELKTVSNGSSSSDPSTSNVPLETKEERVEEMLEASSSDSSPSNAFLRTKVNLASEIHEVSSTDSMDELLETQSAKDDKKKNTRMRRITFSISRPPRPYEERDSSSDLILDEGDETGEDESILSSSREGSEEKPEVDIKKDNAQQKSSSIAKESPAEEISNPVSSEFRPSSIDHDKLYELLRKYSPSAVDNHGSRVLRGLSYIIPFLGIWGLATVMTQSLEVMSDSPLFAPILGHGVGRNPLLAALLGGGAAGWIAFAESDDIAKSLKLVISPFSQLFKGNTAEKDKSNCCSRFSPRPPRFIPLFLAKQGYIGLLAVTAWAFTFVEPSEYLNVQQGSYSNIFTTLNKIPSVRYSGLPFFYLLELLSHTQFQDRAYNALWRRVKQATIWSTNLDSHQERLIGLLEVMEKSADRLDKEGLTELARLILPEDEQKDPSLEKEPETPAPLSKLEASAPSNEEIMPVSATHSRFQRFKHWVKSWFSSGSAEEKAPLIVNEELRMDGGTS